MEFSKENSLKVDSNKLFEALAKMSQSESRENKGCKMDSLYSMFEQVHKGK